MFYSTRAFKNVRSHILGSVVHETQLLQRNLAMPHYWNLFRTYFCVQIRPCGSAKYRWGIKIIFRFSTNKSLYLANDIRYRHSYYGRRIKTSMLSIILVPIWCHFQWPWTNPNPVFKVTPLFGAKYLINGYRYGQSYYRRQIENRTSFNDLEWPLSHISRSRYYSNNAQMVRDRAIVTMAD